MGICLKSKLFNIKFRLWSSRLLIQCSWPCSCEWCNAGIWGHTTASAGVWEARIWRQASQVLQLSNLLSTSWCLWRLMPLVPPLCSENKNRSIRELSLTRLAIHDLFSVILKEAKWQSNDKISNRSNRQEIRTCMKGDISCVVKWDGIVKDGITHLASKASSACAYPNDPLTSLYKKPTRTCGSR